MTVLVSCCEKWEDIKKKNKKERKWRENQVHVSTYEVE